MNKNVISFLNMKGGVGKTTLCKEMSFFLSSASKKKVLVIDIDPQSNCTQSVFEKYNTIKIDKNGIIKERLNVPSINNIFSTSNGNLQNVDLESVIYKPTEYLHIIPGELDTIFMERETGTGSSEQKLINFIDEFKLKEIYDYIFIDCPPTYSFYTVSALLASDFYFVPLKPDAYSLLGLDLLERVVSDLRKSYRTNFTNKPIKNLGVVFTMLGGYAFKGYERNKIQIEESFKENDIYFFNNIFPRFDKLSTGKLETFILDRDDNDLIGKLELICDEFEERVRHLNEGKS
ncbi:ParA family protein [Dethiothermospora halolimnae]|uniref:ParA family protein n=1 Tax=Dethiothermospora halolimnae TaxID=3114390 RepID=UPI003CCC17E0